MVDGHGREINFSNLQFDWLESENAWNYTVNNAGYIQNYEETFEIRNLLRSNFVNYAGLPFSPEVECLWQSRKQK